MKLAAAESSDEAEATTSVEIEETEAVESVDTVEPGAAFAAVAASRNTAAGEKSILNCLQRKNKKRLERMDEDTVNKQQKTRDPGVGREGPTFYVAVVRLSWFLCPGAPLHRTLGTTEFGILVSCGRLNVPRLSQCHTLTG